MWNAISIQSDLEGTNVCPASICAISMSISSLARFNSLAILNSSLCLSANLLKKLISSMRRVSLSMMMKGWSIWPSVRGINWRGMPRRRRRCLRQYDNHEPEVDYMDVSKQLQLGEDARKQLQLREDAQEKEKMVESGEYHWDKDLDVDCCVQVGY